MDIASRLDMAMRAKNFHDQKQLARSSGVPASTINRILSGRNKSISITHAQQLSRALGVSMHWLACGEDDTNEDTRLLHAIISTKESRLLETFRNCNKVGQSAILVAADAALISCPVE